MTPRRIQMHCRPGGWKADNPNAVVVARPTKWGNPWKVGNPGTFWLPKWTVKDQPLECALNAGQATALYGNLLRARFAFLLPGALNYAGRRRCRCEILDHGAGIIADLHELRGRDLACWCSLDSPCHGDILLELANGGGS